LHAGFGFFYTLLLVLKRLYPYYFGDSVFSENIVRLKSMVGAPLASDLSPLQYARTLLSGELGVVMLAVALLHYAGFVLG